MDDDPGLGEGVLSPGPEGGGGLQFLVGQDLAVGQAGVVVDGIVKIAVAAARSALAASLAAQDVMSAALGDIAELLDVDVHQVAWSLVFVAPDYSACGAVEVGQAGETVTGEYPVHRGGVEPEQVGDAGWAPAAQDPDLYDASLGPGRSAAWAVVRTT
jgi:hypothetical protein